MSIEHLKQLRNNLERKNWNIISETKGNEYDLSAVWVIARPDGTNRLHIEFLGLDDLQKLPIEKSYACRIKELPKISVYFNKISRLWPKKLHEFIEKIDCSFKGLDEARKDFSVTRERIKEIEEKALRRLKRLHGGPPDDAA